MIAYKWLTVPQIIAIHDDLIEEFGGKLGVLSESALESTLKSPSAVSLLST